MLAKKILKKAGRRANAGADESALARFASGRGRGDGTRRGAHESAPDHGITQNIP